MKKNIMIATGLLSAVVPMVLANESEAVDDLNNINNINENSRLITSMNKVGKVKGVATNDTLNVRKEPTTNSSIVTTLKNATLINVIGQDSESGWYKISYEGNIGFASNLYIDIIGDAFTAYIVVGQDINIRKEPNWSSDKVSVIKRGESLNVISIEGEWAKVNYNNLTCYAPASYLSEKTSDLESESLPSDTNITKYEVIEQDINVRKEPNWSSDKVAVAKKGEYLNVISIEGEWAKVNYNNLTCYAPASYLSKKTNSSESDKLPNDTNASTVNYEVTGQDINIRKEPNWSSDKVAVAKKGEYLNVISIEGEWAKVNYNNLTCYAPASYLTKVSSGGVVNPPTNNSNPVEKTIIATVNTNDLNIRAGAGMSYSILAKVNKGDTVLIKETTSTNGWYKVELTNGIIGWCYETYIENFREGSLNVSQGNDSSSSNINETINKVISLARAQIGKPYKYGATGPDSFDCSGLTQYVFKNGANINIPRNSALQATAGKYVSKTELQAGDLIFFNTSGSGISHVGIYIGNDEMIHAPSSGKNVQIVKITSSYWVNSYVTARRVVY